MLFLVYTFAISLFVIFYNYFGYALLTLLLTKLKRKKGSETGTQDYFPTVSFIVAAYNEEDCIEKKIINSLNLNYPKDKLEYIFVTDGSTDKTVEIVQRFGDIKILHNPIRKGKSAALNRAVEAAQNEIVLFSDANTELNDCAIINIVRHYACNEVGGVSGEKKVMSIESNTTVVSANEGLYWKYESLLKKIDSEFHTVVGAAGELFSVRKSLYTPIAHDVILDDFVISLQVAQKGYRIIYEPAAYASELPSLTLKDEQKRKVRIAAGGFQAIKILWPLLLFWKHPKLSYLYISHRFLRWTLTPLALIFAFLTNLVLHILDYHILFSVLFSFQVCFYTIALISGFNLLNLDKLKIFKIPYYFVFMNVSVVQGFYRYAKGKQPVTWEKSKRSHL